MSEAVADLKDLLSTELLGKSWDPSDYSQERWLMEHLVERVRNLEMGDESFEEVRAEFDRHGLATSLFDPWFVQQVELDRYSPP